MDWIYKAIFYYSWQNTDWACYNPEGWLASLPTYPYCVPLQLVKNLWLEVRVMLVVWLSLCSTESVPCKYALASGGLNASQGLTHTPCKDLWLAGGDWVHHASYLDNVIFSNTWLQHLKVFGKIQNTGLTLNISKCDWVRQGTQCLGYLLEEERWANKLIRWKQS